MRASTRGVHRCCPRRRPHLFRQHGDEERGFVSETYALGSATGAPVVDLQSLSVSLCNGLRFCPRNGDFGSGPAGAFFRDDRTPFETRGAQRIAGLVAGDVRGQKLCACSRLK